MDLSNGDTDEWNNRVNSALVRLSKLIKEKWHSLARGDSCFALFLGDSDQVFLNRRKSQRVARGQTRPIPRFDQRSYPIVLLAVPTVSLVGQRHLRLE